MIWDRFKKRAAWNGYRLKRLAWWMVWDRRLSATAARQALAQAQIYARREPKILMDDALARNLGVPMASSPRDTLSPEDERAYRLSPGFLEPEAGYACTQDGLLIEHSLSEQQRDARRWNGMQYFSAVPIPRVLKQATSRQYSGGAKLGQAASLRTVYETNYFHVLIDALPKVAFFEALGMPEDAVLVVADTLAQQPFFQAIQQRGSFAKRRWHVQHEHEYLQAETLWCGRVSEVNLRWIDGMLDMIDAHPNAQGTERIFVTRSPSAGRTIINMADVSVVLRNHRIEMIDAAQLSWPQQVDLFGSARLIAGIHGAGLTNLVFRRGLPTDVFEIFSPFGCTPAYYYLAKLYGYRYAYLMGQNGQGIKRYERFTVAPAELDAALQGFSS